MYNNYYNPFRFHLFHGGGELLRSTTKIWTEECWLFKFGFFFYRRRLYKIKLEYFPLEIPHCYCSAWNLKFGVWIFCIHLAYPSAFYPSKPNNLYFGFYVTVLDKYHAAYLNPTPTSWLNSGRDSGHHAIHRDSIYTLTNNVLFLSPTFQRLTV